MINLNSSGPTVTISPVTSGEVNLSIEINGLNENTWFQIGKNKTKQEKRI